MGIVPELGTFYFYSAPRTVTEQSVLSADIAQADLKRNIMIESSDRARVITCTLTHTHTDRAKLVSEIVFDSRTRSAFNRIRPSKVKNS